MLNISNAYDSLPTRWFFFFFFFFHRMGCVFIDPLTLGPNQLLQSRTRAVCLENQTNTMFGTE
ncbi:hypothetical protein BDV37DRAFT_262364 [Aspergillus pseudonomiae]|uniref:Uncharacterized protein n=1 Tax=Aspergillus pseudonomiae TaxID=1506151 RepID=A0A5N7CXV7_9EURO|nr:uncharacterized protein BDV37DRAFT_262364 [Aspergillus pseudonomiae]KAE8398779.1 hypothetical protein BDV37DRAFT_262364 [Aspergillus pseudonomiae]